MGSRMPRLLKEVLARFDEPSREIVEACQRVFGTDLVAVIMKGSVVRGDFIPYYSDFDIHIFLHKNALEQERAPAFDLAMSMQATVGRIDLERLQISAVQVTYNNADSTPSSWSSTPPEVSRTLYGRSPEYDTHSQNWGGDAISTLEGLEDERRYEIRAVHDISDSLLYRLVRRQGAFLKGGAHSLAGLFMDDIRAAQILPYWDLDDYLRKQTSGQLDLSKFHEYAERWKETRTRPGDLRSMFRIGMAQLESMAGYRTRFPCGKKGASTS